MMHGQTQIKYITLFEFINVSIFLLKFSSEIVERGKFWKRSETFIELY